MLSSATWSSASLPASCASALLESRDVGDHRHRAALTPPGGDRLRRSRPSGARSSNVMPDRIAQAFHPLGDQRVDVAVAVVPVLGQVAQQVGIGTSRAANMLRRHAGTSRRSGRCRRRCSGFSSVYARAPGMLSSATCSCGFLLRHFLLGALARGDVRIGENQAAVDDGRVLRRSRICPDGQLVFECVRLSFADPIQARRSACCFSVAGPVVAAFRVEPVELDRGRCRVCTTQRDSRAACERPCCSRPVPGRGRRSPTRSPAYPARRAKVRRATSAGCSGSRDHRAEPDWP